ncbi:MupG family TIM beta-alpha barrel fold protein [Paenibacillus macquariensis]|uniref:Cell surface protein n=1 Tax=Paenibacillus macquariensis TaxID=948756 RepID=A0ABY1JTZ4_9BACL|nr:MupG family TIM beta-alpha barrel fold protein [Paenibacillus macquariensis]MEC0091040.1 MupG family TIM beta-alpha barrel fold protein [Paenibacillus macquariensis]SIQ77965.1 hypothetical protein SAMN05421578_10415 [Paenibacillus macquariensis]
MLGISIFVADRTLEENMNYMKEMKEAGCTEIFTSLHMPEDDIELLKEKLLEIANAAKQLGMDLMADISGKALEKFSFPFLLQSGVTGLRMDFGFSAHEIAAYSQKMKIALNASTLTSEFLATLIANHICLENIEAWHNYYPRPETGLDKETFKEKNKWLQAEGITTMAFIPGDGLKRKPLFESLPTLEKHRNQSSFLAYLELEKDCAVDKIFVGDLTLSEWSQHQFQRYEKGIIPLRVTKELPYALWDIVHRNRLDAARDVVRSETARTDEERFVMTKNIAPMHTTKRSKGTITVDNYLYGRYEHELQITLTDLTAHEGVNVIGHVIDDDIPLLYYVRKGGSHFSFTTAT